MRAADSLPKGQQAPDRLLTGILAMLMAMFAMTILDGLAKWLGAGYPISEVVFFRSLFGLLPVLAVAWLSGGRASLRVREPGLHLLRAAFLLGAGFSFFFGLRFLGLAEAIAIAFLSPVFVTALSVPILGEAVGPRRWAAVAVGFLGALIIVRPSGDSFTWAAVLPATAAFCYALAMLLTRRLSRSNSTASLMMSATLLACLASAALLPFGWRTPDAEDFLLFVLLGLVGGTGSYFMTLAYRSAPAAVIAPFEYSTLLWGALIGWLVWHELPDGWTWVGATILAASGLYILHRERRVSRR
jgi:drug/metabolite transporter (DMT)-like permease